MYMQRLSERDLALQSYLEEALRLTHMRVVVRLMTVRAGFGTWPQACVPVLEINETRCCKGRVIQ